MRSEVTVSLRKDKQEQELMKRRNVSDAVDPISGDDFKHFNFIFNIIFEFYFSYR